MRKIASLSSREASKSHLPLTSRHLEPTPQDEDGLGVVGDERDARLAKSDQIQPGVGERGALEAERSKERK